MQLSSGEDTLVCRVHPVLIFVPKGDPSEMTAEFERQNKHLIGEKVSGLVTADSLPQSANSAAEPDRPPPGSDEAVAL